MASNVASNAVFNLEIDENGAFADKPTGDKTTTPGKQRQQGSPTDPEMQQFYASRPFMFLVRHNMTGLILFAGRVLEPQNRRSACHLSIFSSKNPPPTGVRVVRSPMVTRRRILDEGQSSPCGSPPIHYLDVVKIRRGSSHSPARAQEEKVYEVAIEHEDKDHD